MIKNMNIIEKMKKLNFKKNNISKKTVDLKRTLYLKTAIIDNECKKRLNNDIFDGPKYLIPRFESISLYLGIYFFNDPEKLLHKLALSHKIFTSFFVRQL
tara:strand:+ start:787 stop:1086 length:300 start_codon:yes stop_codon:yes gene_type:complete